MENILEIRHWDETDTIEINYINNNKQKRNITVKVVTIAGDKPIFTLRTIGASKSGKKRVGKINKENGNRI